jgi:signal transduction histidine kinase
LGSLSKDGKLGLAGMNERGHLLGGNAKLESKPGEGTLASIEVQLQV